MKNISLILPILSLSACTLHADITPKGNILQDAIVGTYYFSEINISGGAVFSADSSGKERFVGEITPNDIGLHLQYCNDSPANNCVQVKGTPIRSEVAKVRVHGGLFGTNIAVGSEFDKIYTITIKKPE